MKKPTAIQISILEPCTQACDEMQPMQGGRHCAHCQKVVVDFTRMTDEQLQKYFSKYDGGCGMFTSEQLTLADKKVSILRSNRWARVAAGISLMLRLSKTVSAQQNEHKKANIEQHVQKKQATATTDSIGILGIYGTLTNEKGQSVAYAEIEISKDGVILEQNVTDLDGNYTIAPLSKGIYSLKFSYLDQTLTITNIPVQQDRTRVDGKLTFHIPLGMVGMIAVRRTPWQRMKMRMRRIFQ